MKRREVIGGLVTVLSSSHDAVRAQTRRPTIGYLGQSTAMAEVQRMAAFVQRLRELGWVEGQNVAIELRWSEGQIERSSAIASECVQLKVDVKLQRELHKCS